MWNFTRVNPNFTLALFVTNIISVPTCRHWLYIAPDIYHSECRQLLLCISLLIEILGGTDEEIGFPISPNVCHIFPTTDPY